MRWKNSGRWRTASAVLGAVALTTSLATEARGQDAGKVLRVALVQEIDHLNPFLASFASSVMVGRMTWEYLTPAAAGDNTPSPALATSWRASGDRLTWTFSIRQGIKWSDGRPMTAKDIAYTYHRIMTDKVAQEANGTYVGNFDTVTAPDETTLVIKTRKPQASMTAIDIPVVPEHIWSKIAKADDPATDSLAVIGVGDGPFVITEYRPSQLVRLKANPDYWRGRPKIDELQFVSYTNADAAVNALRNGEVDVVNRLTPAQFESLRNSSGITTGKAIGRRYRDLLLNPGARNAGRQPIGDGNPALADVEFRRAIARAVDPQTLIDRVLGGYGQLGGGIVPAAFPLYHWEPGPGQRYTFDPVAANAELDRAGYPRGADGVRAGKDGKPLNLRLVGKSSEDFSQRAADYVVSWLRAAGIGVTRQLVSDNEVDERTSAGEYDLALSSWGTSPDPDYILAKQTCAALPAAGGSNSSSAFFCDPEFDSLYARESTDLDPARRADEVKQAQARYYDQVPSVVLDYDNALEAYRSDRFTGFPTQPSGNGAIMEQTGYWSFYGAIPASGQGGGTGGLPAGAWLGIGAGVVVLVAIGAVMATRRRKRDEDRE